MSAITPPQATQAPSSDCQVTTLQKGDLFVVKISGIINETADLVAAVGNPLGTRIEINTKEIARFNSQGMKAWFRMIQHLVSKSLPIRLVECSPAFVEEANQVLSMTTGCSIESIYVPYLCKSCGTELLGLFRVADIKKLGGKLPDLGCPKCKSNSQFDDDPKVYFDFLSRGAS